MFVAEKGNGSYLNNQRIRVSKKNNLEEKKIVLFGLTIEVTASLKRVNPICSGVENLQGQIDCIPFAPNQGQLQVMWQPSAPGCEPVGFYRGDDLDNLQFVPYGQWFFNSFYNFWRSSNFFRTIIFRKL